ncbi:MAG TPA: DUF2975 domain-containing protein [Firmicutes bacterium]|nr:DUF2975 domain-containing protein [Bacillota bacterium]
MYQKNLSYWLKAVIIGVLVCLLGLYGFFIPMLGKRLTVLYPEYLSYYFPWLVLISLTAIPCLVILGFGWKIARNIGIGQAFSHSSALGCRAIAYLCFGDTLFFFAGNLLFLLLNKSHPAVLIASFLLLFVGVSLAVVFITIGRLVDEAALIQEENRMTI